jgi:hypothetical protein
VVCLPDKSVQEIPVQDNDIVKKFNGGK